MGDLGRLSGIDVVRVDERMMPYHPTRTYTVRYECHPHIVWLLRFLRIPTFVEATYRCHEGPYFMNGKIFATDNQMRLLREAVI